MLFICAFIRVMTRHYLYLCTSYHCDLCSFDGLDATYHGIRVPVLTSLKLDRIMGGPVLSGTGRGIIRDNPGLWTGLCH